MTTLPPGWVDATIPLIADNLDSQRVPVNKAARAVRSGVVPYYGATGQVGWIDRPLFNEQLCLLGEDGAPFLDRDKPKAYLIDGPSWVNNHAHVLRALRGATSNRFLKYVLDWTDYGPYVNGTTRLKLTKGALATIPIPLPPLKEQERIVAAIEEQFSRLDFAEESLRQARLRANAYTASAVAEALAGDWPTVRLGDITQEQCYGTSAKTSDEPVGVPVLRMGNIQNGRLDLSKLKYLPGEHPDVQKLTLRAGDLLFNRTNSPELVGKSAVFKIGPNPTSFASYLIRVRLLPECNPDWASLVINGPPGRQYIARVRTQQVGQANVNGTKLAAMPIPLPTIDEQARIIAALEQHLSAASVIAFSGERAGRRAVSLRASILEQAFCGQLVPQDPDDEPAAVLLEKISAGRSATMAKRPRSVTA